MENMVRTRNVLLKSFVITYAILLLSFVLYCMHPHFFYGIIHHFYGIGHEEAAVLMAQAHIAMKIAAFTLFLMPALALHWEIKCTKKGEEG